METGRECPTIVSDMITSLSDLLANTTRSSHGTAVRFYCTSGYQLQGSGQATCNNGEWTQPIPNCKLPYVSNEDYEDLLNRTGSPDDTDAPWDLSISKESLVLILSVCCCLAFLILVALIFSLALYRRKHRQLQKHKKAAAVSNKDREKGHPWSFSPPPISALRMEEPVVDPQPQYSYRWKYLGGAGYPYASRGVRYNGYNYPLYLQSNNDFYGNGWYQGGQTFSTGNSKDPAFKKKRRESDMESIEITWDAKKMGWHDTYDYKSKIPRPKVKLSGIWKEDRPASEDV